MSSGNFFLGKYVTNKGSVCPIRCQPETFALTLDGVVNANGTGTQTANYPRATVSGSRRRNGVHARTVTVTFLADAAGDGYEIGNRVTLPVFTQDAWESYSDGNEGTYLGAAVRFAGKRAEVIK